MTAEKNTGHCPKHNNFSFLHVETGSQCAHILKVYYLDLNVSKSVYVTFTSHISMCNSYITNTVMNRIYHQQKPFMSSISNTDVLCLELE